MPYAYPPRASAAAAGLVTTNIFRDLTIAGFLVYLVPLHGRTGVDAITCKWKACRIAMNNCHLLGWIVPGTAEGAGNKSYLRASYAIREFGNNAGIIS